MKRLVDLDDPDDEVVRLLIRAGADHQPSPGSKLRLIAALGLGSVVGLSASNVLAWLGTSSGKVALAVTVVGVAAGGAYVTTSSSKAPMAMVTAVSSTPTAVSSTPTAVSSTPTAVPVAQPPSFEPASFETVSSEPTASRPSTPRDEVAPQRERKAPPRAARARPVDPAPAPLDTAERRASLGEETRWVDQLRVAAEGEDRPAFERLATEYGERFPEGQLQREVNRLRASLR